jgi:tetratricopeptide (TPR) repeat protein
VKALARVLLLASILLLGLPELSRYAAERRLRVSTESLRATLERPPEPVAARAELEAISAQAAATATALPGDPRPWVVAGSAALLSGRAERALEFYRTAFATGERAEIDLNLGRAYAALGRPESAGAAVLRAVWISPALLATLPSQPAAQLSASIARLEQALAAGQLAEFPPLPPEERR